MTVKKLKRYWSKSQRLLRHSRTYASRTLKNVRPHLTPRTVLFLGGATCVTFVAGYVVTFYWPRHLAFAYATDSCTANPLFLPQTFKVSDSKTYDVQIKPGFSINGYPIYSQTTCVTAVQPPKAHTAEHISFKGLPVSPAKTIRVSSGMQPKLVRTPETSRPIPPADILTYTLTSGDTVFDYTLEGNSKHSACETRGVHIICSTRHLGLSQSNTYELKLWRSFGGKKTQTMATQKLTTVDPVRVLTSSISGGQLVYSKPTEITLTLNKPIYQIGGIHLHTGQTELPIETTISDTTVKITFKTELPRNAVINLLIGQMQAADGGYLAAPHLISFETSGGPKVTGVSIGSSRVQPGSAITLTFDSALAPNQDIAKFIRLEAGTAAANIMYQGRTVTIRPSDIGRCTPFTIRVLDGLQNEHGIAGGSAWSFTSRTLCQTVSSIGSSVQGRSITAYRFGSGPNKIIFVGGTHGDERSSVQILQRWIEQLESNPARIPSHQTIIIIPVINPDGYAANRRTNANNVDLNRNFPTSNWKQGVTMPDKSFNAYGGGTEPLSEPESRALASYVLSQGPRLALTYHAAGNVVVPNGSSDSDAIAIEYGKKSTVGYLNNGSTGSFFEYDTTGAFEDWLHERHGLPALLIELKSRTSNDYHGHASALWYIAQL